ncbi:MAG: mandelate racemase/muconate lactonizing enzyme family protein [Verrucomicrobia bacterium]|nr:mandelate racemase/muconate lactonizing enzyme family protein [Verrucomicrobiota bacterium]
MKPSSPSSSPAHSDSRQTTRRRFLVTAGATGLAAPWFARTTRGGEQAGRGRPGEAEARRAQLDEVLRQPVLKRELFRGPIILESVELLRWENSYLCRVRSADGAEGISVAHSGMRTLYPIFLHNLAPFFVGKDARELDRILEKVLVYGFNFRYQGIALGLPLATIEFAILDLLGRVAGCSIGRLLGEIHHPEVAVYVATEWRERPLEETVDRIRQAVAAYDAQALKIKVGYLMFMTADMNAQGPVGKTERLIPLLREIFGREMALYADANGYYEADEAIRVGRLLEENQYAYFEEPVMYDDFDAIKRVADALTIPVANGEQDQSFVNFRWLIAHDGLEIVQPDSYYFGGLIRCMKVGRMAAAFGKTIVPHMSGGGLGFLYNVHLVSVLPNAGAHHEFKGLQTHVPFECPTSPLRVVKGKIKVPTGPGLGVEIDPAFVQKHRPVTA